MNILKLSVAQLANLLEKGEITSVEITNAYLNHIEKHSRLNTYITVVADKALEQAKNADQRLQSGTRSNKLDGIPVAIKDNFLTKGITTTNGSKFYKDFVPPYESTITQRLLNAGMVFLGKTNMDDFAMGSDNTTSYFGPAINPWRGNTADDKVPGGSSGGSASAVAARLAPLSLGTDTGGSIRQPASFCGVVGMKPTYGTCSRYGIFAFASSLDQAGPFSNTVLDNALLLSAMAGYDHKDSTSVHTANNYTDDIGASIKKVTVGIIKEYQDFDLPEDCKKSYLNTIEVLRKCGAVIKEIHLSKTEYMLPVYYIIAPVEAVSNYARYDGIRFGSRATGTNLIDTYAKSRSEGFSDEVKSRMLLGTYNVLQENFNNYIQACKVRTIIAEEYKKVLEEVDVILTPTATGSAFSLQNSSNLSPLEMYYNDVFTVGANLGGLPAISLPVGLSSGGLPVGMQLIGRHYDEKQLYKVAHALEKELQFNNIPDMIEL